MFQAFQEDGKEIRGNTLIKEIGRLVLTDDDDDDDGSRRTIGWINGYMCLVLWRDDHIMWAIKMRFNMSSKDYKMQWNSFIWRLRIDGQTDRQTNTHTTRIRCSFEVMLHPLQVFWETLKIVFFFFNFIYNWVLLSRITNRILAWKDNLPPVKAANSSEEMYTTWEAPDIDSNESLCFLVARIKSMPGNHSSCWNMFTKIKSTRAQKYSLHHWVHQLGRRFWI